MEKKEKQGVKVEGGKRESIGENGKQRSVKFHEK